jgi:hypothetical protein
VDTKKKELVGDFKNGGREWQPQGSPEPVRVHDFLDKKLGKAIPYGVYDVAGNRGWVSVGTDHDTAEFATETIHRWWRHMGSPAYPKAKELLILADGGGGNSSRTRLWNIALQRLADQSGIAVSVNIRSAHACRTSSASESYRSLLRSIPCSIRCRSAI